MTELYLISGLGADKRIFDYLDLSEYNLNHIQWLDPSDGETIERYAERLLSQIHSPRPILICVSFGGMMAVEIAKQIETEKIILVSSAATCLDIPFYFRMVGLSRINKLIPTRLLKAINFLTFWFFGAETNEEKQILKAIIEETNSRFLHWAVDKIVNWKNRTRFTNLVHIHGSNDRILPIRNPDVIVKSGGHLMILNRRYNLSALIKRAII